jgi:putative peptidoglycan lipid II flippase
MSINLRRSATLLMAASVAGYALSFVKEVVVAWHFGVRSGMDAYYAALTLPNFIVGALGFAVSAACLPGYVAIRTRDEARSVGLAKRLSRDVAVTLAAASLALALGAGPLARLFFPRLPPHELSRTITLLRWMSPATLLTGGAALLTGFLNGEQMFALPALASSLVTICTLLAIVLLSDAIGVTALAAGLVAGAFAQVVLLTLLYRRRIGALASTPALSRSEPEVRELLGLAGVFMLMYGMAELNTLIDRVMASGLPEGAVAALGYSVKLEIVPQQILCMPVVTVAYPLLAEHAALGDNTRMEADFKKAVRFGYALLIPACAFLLVFAQPIIEVLFQRGRFGPEATRLVAACFAGFILSLPIMVPNFLLTKLAMIDQRSGMLLSIGLLMNGINVLLNWILMRLWNPPVAGIALATSVAQVFGLVSLVLFLRRRHRWLGARAIFSGAGGYLGPTAAMLAAAGLAWRGSNGAPPIVQLAAAGGVGAAALFLAAHWLGLEEMVRGLALLRQWRTGSEPQP